jgi:hypothetical protein
MITRCHNTRQSSLFLCRRCLWMQTSRQSRWLASLTPKAKSMRLWRISCDLPAALFSSWMSRSPTFAVPVSYPFWCRMSERVSRRNTSMQRSLRMRRPRSATQQSSPRLQAGCGLSRAARRSRSSPGARRHCSSRSTAPARCTACSRSAGARRPRSRAPRCARSRSGSRRRA